MSAGVSFETSMIGRAVRRKVATLDRQVRLLYHVHMTNTNWQERFHSLLADFLRESQGLTDVRNVTGFNERTYDIGQCETCSYTVHELTIYYDNLEGRPTSIDIETTMSELFDGSW